MNVKGRLDYRSCLSSRVECMIPLVLGCKQVVLVGDHQVGLLIMFLADIVLMLIDNT